MYNSQYLIIHKITNKFPSLLFCFQSSFEH